MRVKVAMDLHEGVELDAPSFLESNSEMEEGEETDPLQHHDNGAEWARRRLEMEFRSATEAIGTQIARRRRKQP